MDITLFNAFSYFLSTFNFGYLVLAILLLFVRIFRKAAIRNEAINLLSAVNLSFSIGVLLEMILFAVESFLSYYGESKYEFFVFGENPYDQVVFSLTILMYLTGILFLFKSLRKSWTLTLFMLLSVIFNLFPTLLLRLFRDYLPSPWETSYPVQWYHYLIKVFIFASLSFLVYFSLAKWKKLPFPSIWIR